MVEIKTIAKAIVAILLLALSISISFVVQLYAPTISWILSASAIIYIVISSFIINRKKIRLIGICLCSFVICSSYLFYSVTGGSLRDFAVYGLTLWTITWLILFLLSETIASIFPRRLQ